MTVVNPKSISGINSITTGSGSDDILTIHTNNGTERLRIDSTGTTKIVTGIVTTLTATTGIVTTLTANTVTSLGDVDIADKIVHTGDTNTALRFPAADTFTVETGGTERLRITSDGEIKINTGSGTQGLQFQASSGANANLRGVGTNYGELGFFIGNSEKVRITSDGKIGINDTSPQVAFHVQGANGAVSPSSYSVLDVAIEDNAESALGIIGNSYSSIYFGDAATVLNGGIVYNHSDNGLQIRGSGNVERLRIESDGDIGLLTQTPNLSGYGAPTTSIGKSSNPYSVLELQGNQTSNGAMGVIVGYNSAGSSRIATINLSRKDANNSGSIVFETASSGSLGTRATISNDGLLFGSDTAAANALNDYEEGTFTGGINDFNGTYSNNTGTYTKIGNVVTIQIMISGSGGSGSGSLILTSLPFASEGTPASYRAVGAIHAHTGLVTGGVQIIGLMNNNENKIRIRTVQNNATTTDLNRNGLNSSGWELVIGMVYHTAS